jgi:hypothetical protein
MIFLHPSVNFLASYEQFVITKLPGRIRIVIVIFSAFLLAGCAGSTPAARRLQFWSIYQNTCAHDYANTTANNHALITNRPV